MAYVQTGTPQTKGQLLGTFSDFAPNGSINPQALRDFVSSVTIVPSGITWMLAVGAVPIQLTTLLNHFASTSPGAVVDILPSSSWLGCEHVIWNAGANAVSLIAAGGDVIGGLGVPFAASYSLPPGTIFKAVALAPGYWELSNGFNLKSILTPIANSAAVSENITVAPAYSGSENSITTAFQGDFSNVPLSIASVISGAATLGQPTTGYQYSPATSGLYGYMLNQSGWNNSTSNETGRTAATLIKMKIDNYGQGDAMAFNASGFVTGGKPGATSYLANPAVSLFAGQVDAGSAGVYLNPIEINLNDHGFDVAGAGFVTNLKRTANIGALFANWLGFRAQSTGTMPVDVMFSAIGLARFGLDLSYLNLDNNKCAISLSAGQRIYLNAIAGNPLASYPSALELSYIEYQTGVNGIIIVAGSVPALQVTSAQVALAVPLVPPVYTLATLPSGINYGSLAFVSNGRKPGEGPGAGTGVPVFFNQTNQWFSMLSGIVITA